MKKFSLISKPHHINTRNQKIGIFLHPKYSTIFRNLTSCTIVFFFVCARPLESIEAFFQTCVFVHQDKKNQAFCL